MTQAQYLQHRWLYNLVDIITPTKTVFSDGKTPCLLVTFEGFDAAAEYGIFDAWEEHLDWTPRCATAIVTRTSGSQNTIDVDVNVGMVSTVLTTATDINNITAKDTYKSHPADGATDDKSKHPWRYWKVLIMDEGSGNELKVDLWLYP